MMDRKEFIDKLGIGAAVFTLGSCVAACKKTPSNPCPAPANVNFTLNLTDPANSALNSSGGYIYTNGIIIGRTPAGGFVAASDCCPHAGTTVVYQGGGNDFYCPNHGSVFNANGGVTVGPATSNLKSYSTQLNGSVLHVFG